jgi:hypothetical protein
MLGHPEDWMIAADKLNRLKEQKKIIDFVHLFVVQEDVDSLKESLLKLDTQIMKLISDGWSPYGNILFNIETDGQWPSMIQAMVKYE